MEALKLKNNRLIDFQADYMDYGHWIVNRIREDGTEEMIGHVYTETGETEDVYISTGRTGREILPPTTDFNKVAEKFEHLARLYAIQEHELDSTDYYLNHYSLIQNQNTMQTQNQQNPESKQKKVNQLIFVEYEKAAGDGHFITVVDSYRNIIGRIHKSYNEKLVKYEYVAYDHSGKPMAQNEKLWQLKNEFTTNREALLEQAHQRRIESKEKSQQQTQEKPSQPVKAEERKKETAKVRESKNAPDKQQSKSKAQGKGKQDKTIQDDREQELSDLRYDQGDAYEDRGGMDI